MIMLKLSAAVSGRHLYVQAHQIAAIIPTGLGPDKPGCHVHLAATGQAIEVADAADSIADLIEQAFEADMKRGQG